MQPHIKNKMSKKGGILPGDPDYYENKDWMGDVNERDIEKIDPDKWQGSDDPKRSTAQSFPADANDNLPGCAFANATSSFRVFALTDGFTTIMFGVDAALTIGAKSFSGEYWGFS